MYSVNVAYEEIPFSARIVAIADSFHALISDRPYRKGMPVEKACEILKMGAGIQWDKDLVRQFIQIAPSLSTKVYSQNNNRESRLELAISALGRQHASTE